MLTVLGILAVVIVVAVICLRGFDKVAGRDQKAQAEKFVEELQKKLK